MYREDVAKPPTTVREKIVVLPQSRHDQLGAKMIPAAMEKPSMDRDPKRPGPCGSFGVDGSRGGRAGIKLGRGGRVGGAAFGLVVVVDGGCWWQIKQDSQWWAIHPDKNIIQLTNNCHLLFLPV